MRVPAIAAVAVMSLVVACSDDDTGLPDAVDVNGPPEVESTADVETGPDPDDVAPDDVAPTTEPPETDPADPPQTTDADDPSTTAETGGDDAGAGDETPAPDDPETSVLVPRVGTWVVGDAAEVDVDLTDEGLVLLDVRENEGWNVSIDVERPDEIEIDFVQGDVDWQIEIEYENGILEIEIDQDIENAQPGVVDVFEAGEVEFALDGGALQLVNVAEQPGWSYAVTEESADEIDLEFVNGQAKFDVEIELDDGVIQVEVDFEVEGPFSL